MNNFLRPQRSSRISLFLKAALPLCLLILFLVLVGLGANVGGVLSDDLSLEAPVVETAQAATSISSSSGMNSAFRSGSNNSTDYNITADFEWDISSKTSAGNNAVSDYQYSGTLDGQNHTIKITKTSCSSWSTNLTVGNPKIHGVLCGILAGTVKNLTIEIATKICLFNENTDSSTCRHIIGIICGRLYGGNIQNCTVKIDDGCGIDVWADASGSDKINGCVLGGFVGHTYYNDSTAKTCNIVNCKLINNGAICGMSTRAQIKTDSTAVGDSWRCTVGGFIGEVWDKKITLNLKGCQIEGDSTSCIAAYGWRASNAYHQNNKAGGLIGAVKSDAGSVSIDSIVYKYKGKIITTYDDKRARALIGYLYGTNVTVTNLIFQGGITTYLHKVSDSTFSHVESWTGTPSGKTLGKNSAVDLTIPSDGSGTSITNTSTLYGNGGKTATTNSYTYCPAYAYKFGSSAGYSSSYGTVDVSIYTANSTSLQSKVTVTVSPASGYGASSISNAGDYVKLYTSNATSGQISSTVNTSKKCFGVVGAKSTASINRTEAVLNLPFCL